MDITTDEPTHLLAIESAPGIVGFTDMIFGGLLIGIGLVLGLLTASWVSRSLQSYAGDRQANEFKFSQALIPKFEHEEWDPCEIRTEPNVGELATHEEHVLRLLIANGGRMKQTALISETSWSQAKVSRLLKRMEEHGDISRINVGRTNLVVLGKLLSGPEARS